jgi:hypothetical protein
MYRNYNDTATPKQTHDLKGNLNRDAGAVIQELHSIILVRTTSIQNLVDQVKNCNANCGAGVQRVLQETLAEMQEIRKSLDLIQKLVKQNVGNLEARLQRQESYRVAASNTNFNSAS